MHWVFFIRIQVCLKVNSQLPFQQQLLRKTTTRSLTQRCCWHQKSGTHLFFIGSVDEQKNIEFTSYCPRHNHNNSAASQKNKVNRPRPMVSSLWNSKANSRRSWMQRCVQKQECKGYFVLLLPKARTCFQSSNWKYLLPGKPTAGLLLKRWQPTWGLINLLHPYMFLFFDKDRCISWKVLDIFGALAFFVFEKKKKNKNVPSKRHSTILKEKTLPSL